MLPLKHASRLPSPQREALQARLAELSTLEAVARWGFAQQPAATIEDVVVQDEYTHDVVMAWTAGCWLVFGTT